MQIIPKVLHRIWVGAKTRPKEFDQYWESWHILHPRWRMFTWDVSMLKKVAIWEPYMNKFLIEFPAQMADLCRYSLIEKFGGVYVDCDFECFKNIEPLLEDVYCFFSEEDPNVLTNAIFGATTNNDIIKRLVISSRERMQDTPDNVNVNDITGPGCVNHVVQPIKHLVTIFKPDVFHPYSYREKQRKSEAFPNAYAAHHWAGSWQEDH